MELEPGMMLLHYRLAGPIGEGGMGVVWKAVDTTLEREVAIKVLPVGLARDPERLDRFDREARLLASVNHPNIAAVYGLHVAGGLHFLAMELVRGDKLSVEIHRGLEPGRVLALAIAIADALAAAHRQHVIHRDLKPDNIVLDEQGRPKVLDFGLAKLSEAPSPVEATRSLLTREGAVLGTVAYMSPEQAQGLPVDVRSDVFSLGIVLYEMSSGRRPFQGESSVATLSAILRDTPPPLTADPGLDRIIRRCLEKDPARRYPDAGALRDDLAALRASRASSPAGAGLQPPAARRRRLAAWAAPALVLAVLGGLWLRHAGREHWARSKALPRLEAIVDHIQGLEEGRESWDAFVLARQIEPVLPGDPLLERLRPKFTRELSITSEPAGATVEVRYYDEPDANPLVMGTTPLTRIRFPRGFTRVRLILPGQAPLEDVIWNFGLLGDQWAYRFPAAGQVPEGMAYVPPGAFELYMPGLDHLEKQPTAAFAMDRREVSNRAYKRFLDAGGYQDPRWWRQPFLDHGRELPFKEAMARFTDRTGRPGPATWEVGSYPEGRDEHPVAGVSWYEAAAYAEWAGLALPSIFHWNRVAFTVASSRIVPLANLGGGASGPLPGTRSMNRFGVSDLAGNVREWVWNSSGRDQGRFILGGGWNDPDYAFNDAYAQPPMDRAASNGFRCIKPLEPEPNQARLQATLERPVRDFRAEKPVPDPVFAQYLRQFAYDRTPLNPVIEEDKLTVSGIRRQKIAFEAAYGRERMTAYLFLPPAARPPYQVVVMFPGSGSIDIRSSANLELGRLDFLPRSGRAVLWPVYKGTYERGGDLHSDLPTETAFYKDYVVMWGKDLARSIDYLETRPDLDSARIAYYGLSWGAALGAILPAMEPRIKVNLLYVAGLTVQRALPEADAINYVRHVRQPTLMLNGELDFFFPAESSQKPMFDLLGTPAPHKKRIAFPGGHSVPRTEMIRESLAWLDRYLGPVTP